MVLFLGSKSKSKSKIMNKISLTLLLVAVIGSYVLNAQTPTKWRGPDGNGIYNETGLLKQWPAR